MCDKGYLGSILITTNSIYKFGQRSFQDVQSNATTRHESMNGQSLTFCEANIEIVWVVIKLFFYL